MSSASEPTHPTPEAPPAPPRADAQSVGSALLSALRGAPLDYTKGPLGRAIFLLAVPMALEMFMESLFSVVDTWFVGKLGSDAVAVVGLTASIVMLIFCVAMGLAMSATAMVARRVGEGDLDGARVVATQCVLAGFLVAVPLGLLGAIYAEDLLLLMGAAPETAAQGRGFTAVLLAGNVTIFQLFLINAVFRGAGDPMLAMKSLWLGNAVNIVLDPILIFGWAFFPELGLTGAAWATTIGRGTGVAYQFWALHSGAGRVRIGRADLRFEPAVLRRIFTTSGWGILQLFVGMASWIVVMRMLADWGDDVLAGYTIAIRVIVFVLLPAWGIGNAAATLVGQNLGAGEVERARRSAWATAHTNAVCLTLVAALFFFGAEPVVRLFTQVDTAVEAGAQCLAVFALTYPLLGYGMTIVMAFNGAGDTRTPTWLNLFAYWVVQLPLGWLLALQFGMGPQGIFVSGAVAQAVLALTSILSFRTGRWARTAV